MSVDLNDVHELSLDEIEAISGGVIAQFVAGIVIGVAVVIAASEDNPLSAIDVPALVRQLNS
jgi:hypothetical protein